MNLAKKGPIKAEETSDMSQPSLSQTGASKCGREVFMFSGKQVFLVMDTVLCRKAPVGGSFSPCGYCFSQLYHTHAPDACLHSLRDSLSRTPLVCSLRKTKHH